MGKLSGQIIEVSILSVVLTTSMINTRTKITCRRENTMYLTVPEGQSSSEVRSERRETILYHHTGSRGREQ